jgi:hypothetical protein
MTNDVRSAKVELFGQIAGDLMDDPAVTRSTMMGLPCLRLNGAFFASLDPKTGDLIVKLPAARVQALIQAGNGVVFAPSNRVFREWVAIERHDGAVWWSLLREAQAFARHA